MTFRIVRFLILGCLISTDLPAQAPSDESSDDYYPPTVESEGYAIPKHPLLPKKHASEQAGVPAPTRRRLVPRQARKEHENPSEALRTS